MKKFFAVLLSIMLVLSMGTVAFAADGTGTTTGSIKITGAEAGATYNIYRIFDLESYDAEAGAYSYKLSPRWAAFTASDYFRVDDKDYVTWVNADSANDGDAINAFVKDAMKYAKDNNISVDASDEAEGDTLTFGDLALGYYLIDTSLGSLCSITTAVPDAEIREKNETPDLKKEVEEDSKVDVEGANPWGSTNHADIGQTVNFKATITTGKGATNIVMHDTMSAGLALITGEGKIVVKNVTDNYTLVEGTDYKFSAPGACGCTFEIELTDTYEANLGENETIEVTYSAILDSDAEVGTVGNTNTAYIKYGDNNEFTSTPSTTTTYTFYFNVNKYTKDAAGNKVALEGAVFQLKNSAGAVINLFKVSDTEYRMPLEVETTVNSITTGETGKFAIKGLDADTYYLVETDAPEGYNELNKEIKVVIADDGTVSFDNETDSDKTVEVENKKGSILPETGGVGTTIFYIVGITLMLGAVVLFITKKRMAAKAE